MIGATYVFRNKNDLYFFAIKARQAFEPQDQSEWGLWFAEVNEPKAKDRLNEVLDYLVEVDGPDLRAEMPLST